MIQLKPFIIRISNLIMTTFSAHKNVVAFITHSGIAGTFEGLHSGIPMILTPLHFDQFSNAAVIENLGVGVCVDLQTLTKDKLIKALNDVINGTEYVFVISSFIFSFLYRVTSS